MTQTRAQPTTGLSQEGQPVLNRLVVEYDFGQDGGAVGNINLRGDSLPAGAVIVNSVIHVDTVFTSGGAGTFAIQSEGAGDIQAAAAVSGAPWATTGPKVPTKTATSAHIKTTVDRTIIGVVATAALTAGKCRVVIDYLLFA